MRKIIYNSFFLILFLYFICYPGICLKYSLEGIELWYRSIVPTLFPFMICSQIFVSTDVLSFILRPLQKIIHRYQIISEYGIFASITGFLCGYPMGMKTLADLYDKNLISENECHFLGPLINNVSPGFIISFVAEGIFHCQKLSVCLVWMIYGAPLFYGILFYIMKKPELNSQFQEYKQKKTVNGPSIIAVLDQSVMNTMQQLIKICGYIIFFSLLTSILEIIHIPEVGSALLTGMFEISRGISEINKIAIDSNWKVRIMITILAFGGLCSAFQSYSYMKIIHLPIKTYIKTKAMIAIIALLLSLVII